MSKGERLNEDQKTFILERCSYLTSKQIAEALGTNSERVRAFLHNRGIAVRLEDGGMGKVRSKHKKDASISDEDEPIFDEDEYFDWIVGIKCNRIV